MVLYYPKVAMKKVKYNMAEAEVGKSLNSTKRHSRFSPVAKKCKILLSVEKRSSRRRKEKKFCLHFLP